MVFPSAPEVGVKRGRLLCASDGPGETRNAACLRDGKPKEESRESSNYFEYIVRCVIRAMQQAVILIVVLLYSTVRCF